MSALTDKVDTFLAGFVGKVEAAQEGERGKRTFWQGALTPADIPADDQRRPTEKDRKAGGRTRTWDDFLGADLPANLNCSIEIHEYVGPQGKGWTLYTHVREGGKHLRKAYHRGPETYRDAEQQWTDITPGEELGGARDRR